jgi:hypothetical protein
MMGMFHPRLGSVKCRAVPALGEVLPLRGCRAGGEVSVLPEGVEVVGEEERQTGAVFEAEAVCVVQLGVGDERHRLAGAAEGLGVAGADAEELDAVRRRALVASATTMSKPS